MRRQLAFFAPPAALTGIALLAAGCGGGYSHAVTAGGSYGQGAAGPRAKSASVAVRSTPLGSILVDGRGRSLYLFEKDKGTASSCSGSCAAVWPPLTTAGKGVALGLPTGRVGAIKRADGTKQVTYAGHPLYTYAGDGKAGDVKGQGLDQFGAEWYVLARNGGKIDNG
jgi:predicted lipoprotein with Yx(FWY)xxD motif